MPKLILLIATLFLSVNLCAKKTISVGGSVTETLVALGHGKDLIGVDLSSAYPKEVVKDLPNVGYWLQLPKEGILSLKPEVVIASERSKPKKFINTLPSYGIKTYLIDDKPTIESAKKKITQVAEALGEQEKAKVIIARIEKNIKQIQKEIKNKKSKPKVLFLFSRGKGLIMAAGKKTSAGAMIAYAGGENVITNEQYTKISEESILKMNPDVVLVSNHGRNSVQIKGAIASTNAGKNGQVYQIDMLLISGFTVRVDEALEKLTCMFNKNSLSYCEK